MNEWWTERWLRRHALAAPFGVFIATVLLAYLFMPDQRQPSEFMQAAAGFVDLGAVVYGMAAVVIEKGITLMFWALEQRQKRQKAMRDEIAAQVKQEIIPEIKREVIAELGPLAKEKGITTVDELLKELAEENTNSNERDK